MPYDKTLIIDINPQTVVRAVDERGVALMQLAAVPRVLLAHHEDGLPADGAELLIHGSHLRRCCFAELP